MFVFSSLFQQGNLFFPSPSLLHLSAGLLKREFAIAESKPPRKLTLQSGKRVGVEENKIKKER